MNIHWKQVIAALLVGFVAGGLTVSGLKAACFQKSWKHGDMKTHIMKKFDKKLNLTEDQKQKVSAIFDETHPKMMALRAETRPKFEALKTEASQKIRLLLTEDQQVKFDQMEAKWKERMKKNHPDFSK